VLIHAIHLLSFKEERNSYFTSGVVHFHLELVNPANKRILALCNLPIGRDMDGKVITEAIERDFLNKYPVKYIDTYEDIKIQCEKNGKKDLSDSEAMILKNQLRNLGYF